MTDETHKGDTPKGEPAKARFCGKPGRSGAPKKNRNNLRHGLRAGQLPADAKYIEHRLNGFRRTLEDSVIEFKGKVSIADAAAIQTALRWERHAALAQRWLNKQYDDLKPEQRLHFSREIAKASAERDKALTALQLDRSTTDPWSIIDITPADDDAPGNLEEK